MLILARGLMKSQMYRDIVLWKLGREGVHFPVVEIIEDASVFGVESLKTLERISDLWECTVLLSNTPLFSLTNTFKPRRKYNSSFNVQLYTDSMYRQYGELP